MFCCQSLRLFNSSRAFFSKNVILLILKSDALDAEKSNLIHFQSIAAKLIGRFVRDQRGATMVEYGLLVALVAVAVIAAVTTLGGSINSFFQSADDGLNGV
jgi:pilus assembly protein Flp/PilA